MGRISAVTYILPPTHDQDDDRTLAARYLIRHGHTDLLPILGLVDEPPPPRRRWQPTRRCSVDRCARWVHSHDMCRTHWRQWALETGAYTHGRQGYDVGCRCDECRTAKAQANRRRSGPDAECPMCGTPLVDRTGGRIYCSPRCKRDAERERRRGVEL